MSATALAIQPDQPFPAIMPEVAGPLAPKPPVSVQPHAVDQRRAHRRAERTAGMIKVRGFRISVPCCIQNTSATGACVTINAGPIEDAAHLPDSITLVFVRELVEIEAHIMWREGNRFGVRFTSRFRRTPA